MQQLAKNIAAARHKCGLTQGQLADLVGVSHSAVSKWEMGATCPDIALLAPIARALHTTPDALLNFRPQLDSGQVQSLVAACSALLVREGLCPAWDQAKALVHQYPADSLLLLKLGSFAQQLVLCCQAEKQAKQVLQWGCELLERCREIAQGETAQAAIVALTAYYSMLERTDEAVYLLEQQPPNSFDPRRQLAPLYARQGKDDRAAELAQQDLYMCAFMAVTDLMLLANIAQKGQDARRQQFLLQRAIDVSQVLGLQVGLGQNLFLALAGCLATQGEVELALDALERYADLATRWPDVGEIGTYPWFDRIKMTAQPMGEALLKPHLCQLVEEQTQLDPLRRHPRYAAVLQRLRALGEQSGENIP